MFNPAYLQIIIDVALLAAVIFMLWRVNVSLKQSSPSHHKEMIQELAKIVKDSQLAADTFLKTLEQSRLAIKQSAIELDIKEKRVRLLLDGADLPKEAQDQARPIASADAGLSGKERYREVVDMVTTGLTPAQTAAATGFTEAEIGLILDLYRIKDGTMR